MEDYVKGWIEVVIGIAIALAMFPVITGLIADANISGAGGTLLSVLVPLFIVFAVLLHAAKMI
jgi:hypothetical protein